MRASRTGGLLVLAFIAAAAFAAGPVAAAPPAFCDDKVLRAEHLPERFSLHNCDVVGAQIVGGGVQMSVPPRGKGLSIRSMTTDGENGMDVRTTRDGHVEIDIEESSLSPLPVPAAEEPPANDLFAQAESVAPSTAFDWSVPGTTHGATASEPSDDQADEACQIAPEDAPVHTVWFAFTAQRDEQQVVVEAVTGDLAVPARVDVFTSWDGSMLDYAACDGDGLWGVWDEQTYFIRVGTNAPSDFVLRWHPPRPLGNDFAAPNVISQPFFYDNYSTEAMLGATLQAGEPVPPCKAASTTGTVWHRIQPGSLRRLLLFPSNGWSEGSFALYTGSSLGGLTRRVCSTGVWQRLVILPASGPYYVQYWVTSDQPQGQLSVISGEPYPDQPNPCDQKNRSLMNVGPRKPLRWRFNGAKTPAPYTAHQARLAISSGMSVITQSKNDCGIADQVNATTEYLGTTTRTATGCAATPKSDGVNVVDFGPPLQGNELGRACSWLREDRNGVTRISETDIRLTRGAGWSKTPDAPSCSSGYDLVGVVAHEVGHAFGLLHPYDAGNLTMSAVGTSCNAGFRTLGRGDVLGLRSRY